MVARQRSPTVNISQLQMTESLAFGDIEGMTEVEDLKEIDKDVKPVEMVPWKNTHDMRPQTLAALMSAKPNLKPNSPLYRTRYRNMTSAAKSLDILRQNLQAAINKEIDLVIKKYLEKFFQPAIRNVRDNLGAGSVTEDLIREVCRAMLEEAKQMYCSVTLHKSTSPPPESEFITPEQELVRKRKASEAEISQYRRAYPPFVKWDPTRVNKDTQFILSTTANKVLGLSSMKEKISGRHPDLVKYMIDQDDREWLTTAGVPGLIQGTPNIALMLLEDIVQLANFEEYRQNALLYVNDLKGFGLPDFIQRKVRAYMTLMRTKYIEPEGSEAVPVTIITHHPMIVTESTPAPSVETRLSPVAPEQSPEVASASSASVSNPPAESSSAPHQSPVQSPDQVQIQRPSHSHICEDVPITFDEAYLLSTAADLENLSPSFAEATISELSCIDPSILPSYIRIQQPIQMSVGVECLSPIATLSAIDSGGLIEFDTSFLTLRGEDEE